MRELTVEEMVKRDAPEVNFCFGYGSYGLIEKDGKYAVVFISGGTQLWSLSPIKTSQGDWDYSTSRKDGEKFLWAKRTGELELMAEDVLSKIGPMTMTEDNPSYKDNRDWRLCLKRLTEYFK